MLIKFDLSTLPPDKKIERAELVLFFIGGSDIGEQCSLFTLTADWEESTVTWNEAKSGTDWTAKGCDYSTDTVVIIEYAAPQAWERYDVTNMVKKMKDNQVANHGFLIKPGYENVGRQYASSENATEENRPMLVITYVNTGIEDHFIGNSNQIYIKTAIHANTLSFYIPFCSNYHGELFDVQGKKIASFSGNKEQWHHIPMTLYASDIYLLSMKVKQNVLFKKVIVFK